MAASFDGKWATAREIARVLAHYRSSSWQNLAHFMLRAGWPYMDGLVRVGLGLPLRKPAAREDDVDVLRAARSLCMPDGNSPSYRHYLLVGSQTHRSFLQL
jgi:hypothetical protein